MVRKLAVVALVVICLMLCSPAWGGSFTFTGTNPFGQGVLNFNPTQNGGSGLLSIATKNGVGAPITQMLISTFLCGGNCAITNGYMTMTSGTEASQILGPGFALYTFNGGGTLNIIGGMGTLGIPNGTTLVTIKFMPGATFIAAGSPASGVFSANLDVTTLILNATLAANLGKIDIVSGSNSAIPLTLDAACVTGKTCTGPLLSDTEAFQFVPEPASLSVVGVGLFAFGAGLRRKIAAT